VVTDLNRLGSQIADLERKRTEAGQGIVDCDGQRKVVEEELETEKKNYMTQRLENEAEMAIRKSDLAVFDFILNMTACKGSEAASQFLQMPASNLRICNGKEGAELHWEDAKVQAKMETMMTKGAKFAIREALTQDAITLSSLSLLESGEDPETTATTTTTMILTVASPTVAPQTAPPAGGQWKKCTDGKPDCGLLHDTMSMQWGKFKDLVDELQVELDKNEDMWEELKEDLNDQLTSIAATRTSMQELLAETISNLNADMDERTEKDTAERELRHEYEKRMAEYKARITEILFTNICAVRKVRNAVMKFSDTSPPSKITDCDISDWVAGECSVPCDDGCPQPDPYACGGWQSLTREPIVPPNEFGIKCPPLTNKKKCNQIKCPVDCVMSEWSTWSKCTKECEGGVQGKTRAIITKPKNGGKFCDTVQESRSCNTGSCDRDCTLHDWTDWSPCSMACGGGLQTRIRTVDVPIRGQDKCPKTTSGLRSGEKMCNEQDCVGDEICVAKQDLIMAIDASGSLRESGFEIVRKFAANLTQRYVAEYYGDSDMQVGALVFGNGHLEPDGTIRNAVNVHDLTTDIGAVKTAIEELTWQKGFTNLAQAFALSDKMLTEGGRADAQSAVLVLWDGKPSFKFQTQVKAKALHDKNVMIFMAPITSSKGDELDFLKHKLASQPWPTNFVRIPGLLDLKHNPDVFEKEIVAKFCPEAISPSKLAMQENTAGYMLIHEGGYPSDACGQWYDLGQQESIDDCANAARSMNQMAFSWGVGRYQGDHCYSEAVAVTQAKWDQWQLNRTGPACPGGGWEPNVYYDTYAIKPAVPV
jgi:hypothetical protein